MIFGFNLRKYVQESEMSVYIAKLMQKRELLVWITRNELKNVIFLFKLRKQVQESDTSVYTAKLMQKRE